MMLVGDDVKRSGNQTFGASRSFLPAESIGIPLQLFIAAQRVKRRLFFSRYRRSLSDGNFFSKDISSIQIEVNRSASPCSRSPYLR